MFRISVSNQKGGVGKTTTAVSVATELAQRGYRTLLIDADPQSNATSHLLAHDQFTKSLADVIVEDRQVKTLSIQETVAQTQVKNLSLIPATLRLAMFESMSADSINILKAKLDEVSNSYDFVVIDNPPSLGQLLLSSLIASTHILIPVSAQPMSHEGLDDLLVTYERIVSRSNKNLKLLGIVSTLFDARLSACAEMHKHTQERFDDLVFETIINTNSKLLEAPAFKQPIQIYAQVSRGALTYAALTDEILSRIGMPDRNPKAVDEAKQTTG